MILQINGQTREFPDALTVAALIAQLGMKADRVAVELNLGILPRGSWETTRLKDGDRLEVVHFVGGGSDADVARAPALEQGTAVEVQPPWICPTCTSVGAGKFCANCGEKKASREDFSLPHFFSHAVEAFFHADSKIFLSFRLLFTRPGLLTAEYVRGRRKPYLHPLQLFLVCNLIYFVLQPLTHWSGLRTTLAIHTHAMSYSKLASRMVQHRLAAKGVSEAEFTKAFDRVVDAQARSLVVLMVPMFALGVWLLEWRKRRFFGEHLVFALHFYALWLILVFLVVYGLGTAGITFLVHHGLVHVAKEGLNRGFWNIGEAILFVYLTIAIRTAYRDRWIMAAVKAGALVWSTSYILFAYRFILFFTALYMA